MFHYLIIEAANLELMNAKQLKSFSTQFIAIVALDALNITNEMNAHFY